jgi:transcriptional regulator with XRE-family HTH domain
MLKPNKKLLCSRIRHMRKKNGLSQEQFAELIGIDPNSVSRIECGVHYPSLDTLEKITTVLKVEMRDLFLFNNKESAEEMRAFLIQTAYEASVEKLREVVRAVRKIV